MNMQNRIFVKSITSMAALTLSAIAMATTPDLTSSLELIDNPATNRWQSTSDLTARACLTLRFYQGKLFNGGGEVEGNPGPVYIYSIDPYDKKSTFEYLAGTEAISSYRIASWGDLLAPSQDPHGGDNTGDTYSRTPAGVWTTFNGIPGSVGWGSGSSSVARSTHCWDLEEFDDRIFVACYDFVASTNHCVSFSTCTDIDNAQYTDTVMSSTQNSSTGKWSLSGYTTKWECRREVQLMRFGSDYLFGVPCSWVHPRQLDNTRVNNHELWCYSKSTKKFTKTTQRMTTIYPDLTTNDYELVGRNMKLLINNPYAYVSMRAWHTTPFKGRNLYVGSYDTQPYSSVVSPWEDTIALTSYPLPLMGCSATVTSAGAISATRISFGGNIKNYPWDFCVVGDTVYALTSRYLSDTKLAHHIIWKSTDGINFSEVLSFDYPQNMISLEYRDGYFYVGVGYKGATWGYSYASSSDASGSIYRIRCPQEPLAVVATSEKDTLEEGTTKAFGFKLSAAPTTNLTLKVGVRSSQTVTLDKTSLTFTPSNWSTEQTVNATLVDDSIDDRSMFAIVCGAYSTDVARGEFCSPEITSGVVEVTPIENDISAKIASETLTPTTDTATYTVSMSSLGQLSGVAVSSVAVSASLYFGSTGTVAIATQTGTITAIDTPLTLTFSGLNVNQSYQLKVEFVSAPGVSVTSEKIFKTKSGTAWEKSSYIVSEWTAPAGRTIPDSSSLSSISDGDITSYSSSQNNNTYTCTWNKPQDISSISVYAADSNGTGAINYGWTVVIASVQVLYEGASEYVTLDDSQVTYSEAVDGGTSGTGKLLIYSKVDGTKLERVVGVKVTNGEWSCSWAHGCGELVFIGSASDKESTTVPVISSVTVSNITTEGATITVAGSDLDAGTVKVEIYDTNGTLVKTSTTISDWGSVTVSGLSASTIYKARAIATNGASGLSATASDVTFTTEAEAGTVVVVADPSSDTLAEGATKAFGFKLDSEPTEDMTLAVTVSASQTVTLDKSSLTFTTSNWSTLQYVNVTFVDDAVVDGETILVVCGANSKVSPAVVEITAIDNEAAAVISAETVTTKARSAAYSVTLSSLGKVGGVDVTSATVTANLYFGTTGTVAIATQTGTLTSANTPFDVNFTGLNPLQTYRVVVEIVSADGVRVTSEKTFKTLDACCWQKSSYTVSDWTNPSGRTIPDTSSLSSISDGSVTTFSENQNNNTYTCTWTKPQDISSIQLYVADNAGTGAVNYSWKVEIASVQVLYEGATDYVTIGDSSVTYSETVEGGTAGTGKLLIFTHPDGDLKQVRGIKVTNGEWGCSWAAGCGELVFIGSESASTPVISSVVVSNITSSGATITVNGSSLGNGQITVTVTNSVGTQYGPYTIAAFGGSCTVSGLDAGTDYRVIVGASNTQGSAKDDTTSFQTSSDKTPTISTVTVTEVTTTGATIAVAGSDLDSGSIKVEIYNSSDTLVTTSSTMSDWGSVTVSGLSASTAYKARAIATNGTSGKSTTAADVSFTTDAEGGGEVTTNPWTTGTYTDADYVAVSNRLNSGSDNMTDSNISTVGSVYTGNSFTYTFSGAKNVTDVRIYSSWEDVGRVGFKLANLQVQYSGASDFVELANTAVDWGVSTTPTSTRLYAALAVANGYVATNVTAVKVVFETCQNGQIGIAEIEVAGTAVSSEGGGDGGGEGGGDTFKAGWNVSNFDASTYSKPANALTGSSYEGGANLYDGDISTSSALSSWYTYGLDFAAPQDITEVRFYPVGDDSSTYTLPNIADIRVKYQGDTSWTTLSDTGYSFDKSATWTSCIQMVYRPASGSYVAKQVVGIRIHLQGADGGTSQKAAEVEFLGEDAYIPALTASYTPSGSTLTATLKATAKYPTQIWFCSGATDGGTTSTNNWDSVVPAFVATSSDEVTDVRTIGFNYCRYCFVDADAGVVWSDGFILTTEPAGTAVVKSTGATSCTITATATWCGGTNETVAVYAAAVVHGGTMPVPELKASGVARDGSADIVLSGLDSETEYDWLVRFQNADGSLYEVTGTTTTATLAATWFKDPYDFANWTVPSNWISGFQGSTDLCDAEVVRSTSSDTQRRSISNETNTWEFSSPMDLETLQILMNVCSLEVLGVEVRYADSSDWTALRNSTLSYTDTPADGTLRRGVFKLADGGYFAENVSAIRVMTGACNPAHVGCCEMLVTGRTHAQVCHWEVGRYSESTYTPAADALDAMTVKSGSGVSTDAYKTLFTNGSITDSVLSVNQYYNGGEIYWEFDQAMNIRQLRLVASTDNVYANFGCDGVWVKYDGDSDYTLLDGSAFAAFQWNHSSNASYMQLTSETNSWLASGVVAVKAKVIVYNWRVGMSEIELAGSAASGGGDTPTPDPGTSWTYRNGTLTCGEWVFAASAEGTSLTVGAVQSAPADVSPLDFTKEVNGGYTIVALNPAFGTTDDSGDPVAGTYAGRVGELTLPGSGLVSIGAYAFGGCTNATGTIVLPASTTTLGTGCFALASKLTFTTASFQYVTKIPPRAFEGCSFPDDMPFPAVTEISAAGFRGALLKRVSFSSALAKIGGAYGNGAFRDCTNLVAIAFDANSKIDLNCSWFCYHCPKLETLDLRMVTNIVSDTDCGPFSGCSSLRHLWLGTVPSLPNNFFMQNLSALTEAAPLLTDVHFYGAAPTIADDWRLPEIAASSTCPFVSKSRMTTFVHLDATSATYAEDLASWTALTASGELKTTGTTWNSTRAGSADNAAKRPLLLWKSPTITIDVANSVDADEGAEGYGYFLLTRGDDDPLETTIPVKFTIGGTATAGQTYCSIYPDLDIKAGEKTAKVRVRPLNDPATTTDTTVTLTLDTDVTGYYSVGDTSTATLNVKNAAKYGGSLYADAGKWNLLAHMGNTGLHNVTANTVAAAKYCADHGLAFEVDVQWDETTGVLYLGHDAMTGITADWTNTFENVLKVLPTGAVFKVDAKCSKYAGAVEAIIAAIKADKTNERATLAINYDPGTLWQRVHQEFTNVQTWSYSLNTTLSSDPATLAATIAEKDIANYEQGHSYAWNEDVMTDEFFAEFNKRGITIDVWTVEDPRTIKEIINRGARYVTTNNPYPVQDALPWAADPVAVEKEVETPKACLWTTELWNTNGWTRPAAALAGGIGTKDQDGDITTSCDVSTSTEFSWTFSEPKDLTKLMIYPLPGCGREAIAFTNGVLVKYQGSSEFVKLEGSERLCYGKVWDPQVFVFAGTNGTAFAKNVIAIKLVPTETPNGYSQVAETVLLSTSSALSAYESWTVAQGLTGDDAAWDATPTKWGGKWANAFVYTYGEGLVDSTTTLMTISFDSDGNPVVTTPAVIDGHTDFTPAVIGVPTVTDWTTPIVLEATGNNWTLPSGQSANFFRVRITK